MVNKESNKKKNKCIGHIPELKDELLKEGISEETSLESKDPVYFSGKIFFLLILPLFIVSFYCPETAISIGSISIPVVFIQKGFGVCLFVFMLNAILKYSSVMIRKIASGFSEKEPFEIENGIYNKVQGVYPWLGIRYYEAYKNGYCHIWYDNIYEEPQTIKITHCNKTYYIWFTRQFH